MNKYDIYLNMLNVHPHPYWNYTEDETTIVVFFNEIISPYEIYDGGHMCMCDGPCTYTSNSGTVEDSGSGWSRVLEKLQKMFPNKIVILRGMEDE